MLFGVFRGSFLYSIVECDPEQLSPIFEQGFSVHPVFQMTIDEFIDENELEEDYG